MELGLGGAGEKMVGDAQAHCHNRQGGVAGQRGGEDRVVCDVEARHVVRLAVGVNHRLGGIGAHAAGSDDMGIAVVAPNVGGPGGVPDGAHGAVGVGGQAALVFPGGVENAAGPRPRY